MREPDHRQVGTRVRVRRLALIAVAAALGTLGCGAARGADPVSRPLPAGAEWAGFYQGPNYIFLRITTNGPDATGIWRAKGQRRGELRGIIRGDLLEYRWREYSLNPGSKDSVSGEGYFVYRVTREGHEIIGVAKMGRGDAGALRLARKRMDVGADALDSAFMDTNEAGPASDGDEDQCLGCDADDVDSQE